MQTTTTEVRFHIMTDAKNLIISHVKLCLLMSRGESVMRLEVPFANVNRETSLS